MNILQKNRAFRLIFFSKKKFHYFRQNGCVLPCNMLYLTCK
nr:MAG TPA: hypothetical protein [Caudoviricetes sp.]